MNKIRNVKNFKRKRKLIIAILYLVLTVLAIINYNVTSASSLIITILGFTSFIHFASLFMEINKEKKEEHAPWNDENFNPGNNSLVK